MKRNSPTPARPPRSQPDASARSSCKATGAASSSGASLFDPGGGSLFEEDLLTSVGEWVDPDDGQPSSSRARLPASARPTPRRRAAAAAAPPATLGTIATSVSRECLRSLVVVGQVHRKFLVARSSDGTVCIIDQHAADERVQLESLQRATVGPRSVLLWAF